MPPLNIPLLITSAVYSSAPFVAIADSADRESYVVDSVENWFDNNQGLKIVLCDGSGFDFNLNLNLKKYTKLGILEILVFKNNKEHVRLFGKGYGEGEIIEYALRNSSFLSDSEHFAKCTGKQWVENYNECISRYNSVISLERIYLHRYSWKFSTCDTRFFIVNKIFYTKFFMSCYKSVNDFNGCYLEHVFAEVVRVNKIRSDFMRKPLIFGYSGSTGNYCQTQPESWKRVIFRNLRRLWF